MIAEGAEPIANAMVHRIPNDAAPAGIGHIDPDLQPALLNIPIQIEVGDSGFYNREMPLVVHLNHPVHPLQIENDAAGEIGRRPAISQVLAR